MEGQTYIIPSPNIWANTQTAKVGCISPTTLGESQYKSTPHTIISVRLSDREIRTVSSGGAGSPSSAFTVRGTTSFTAIHQDISASNPIVSFTPLTLSGSGSERPGLPNTGEETPPATGELLPVGDMLLPMLAMAVVYVVVKFFRKRKTSKAL